jgi:hypothetical protein
MKKVIYLLLVCLLIRCEPDDPRDNWVGQWRGTTIDTTPIISGGGPISIRPDQEIALTKKGEKDMLSTSGAMTFMIVLESPTVATFHYVEPLTSRGDYWVTCNLAGDSLTFTYTRFPGTIKGKFARK